MTIERRKTHGATIRRATERPSDRARVRGTRVGRGVATWEGNLTRRHGERGDAGAISSGGLLPGKVFYKNARSLNCVYVIT